MITLRSCYHQMLLLSTLTCDSFSSPSSGKFWGLLPLHQRLFFPSGIFSNRMVSLHGAARETALLETAETKPPAGYSSRVLYFICTHQFLPSAFCVFASRNMKTLYLSNYVISVQKARGCIQMTEEVLFMWQMILNTKRIIYNTVI